MSTPIDLNFDGVIATQVDLSKPQAPTSGVYGALFQPLFGGLSPENQQEVWNYFLYKNNLQDPPPTTQQTQDIFKNYAIDVYKFLQRKILEENFVVNLPLLQPPTSGFYATAFQNYFGTISAQEKQQVWVQFLVNNDFTTTAPPTDALTETKFIQYAASVFGLDSTVSYNFSILEPPTTGFFANAFQSYFAGLSPLQQKKIWVQFLINNHFTVTGPTQDAATMQIFMAYANAVLSVIQNQDVHSPEEVKKRYIMSQTIEALLKMLGSLQDAIGVQSRNLIFYGKWQQEYTKMMARVPTYTGSPDMSVKVPPTLTPASMDSFTFGYDKISVSDIADWWAASSLDGKTQAFVMSSLGRDFFGQSLFTITFTPQSGSTPGSIFWTGSGGAGTIQIPLQNNVLTFQDNPAQTKRDLAQDAYATAFKNAFINAWNGGVQSSLNFVNGQNLGAINAVQATTSTTPADMQPRSKPDTSAYSAMELPWGYSYVVPEAAHTDGSGNVTVAGKLSDDNAKARGEVNAKLQAMIDNIRSRRKTIQTSAQRLQSDLDQSRQTVTKQSDILNSVLQSITDLVKSIFRK